MELEDRLFIWRILDASAIRAIYEKSEYPELIDMILKLGYKLLIPSLLWKYEIECKSIGDQVQKDIDAKKLAVRTMNTMKEISEFRQIFSKMHLGEIDVILAYFKFVNSGIKAYCVLDEKRGRTVAKDLNADVIGVVGLLLLLKKEKIIPPQEIKKISKTMVKNGFRLSHSLRELLEAD